MNINSLPACDESECTYPQNIGKEKGKLASIKKYTGAKMKEGTIPTLAEMQKIRNKNLVQKIQEVIDNNNFEYEEVLKELQKNNTTEDITKALLSMVCGHNKSKEEFKNKVEIKVKDGEVVKLFFNIGKKDNIKVKDFVGSIAANCGISGEKIGKINILDKFSFIEVPGEYVEDILNGMKDKQVKGRNCNVEVAKQ